MPARGAHWLGVLLLFIASVLLLFVTISAPVLNDLGLLRVELNNGTSKNHHSTIYFGSFSWCTTHVAIGGTYCTDSHIGYNPSRVVYSVDQTQFDYLLAGSADSLTRVMVLHPIACGFAFIAFLVSIGADVVGSLAGGLIAFAAWILTTIVMATDFIAFGIVRHHVRKDTSLTRAYYDSGIWLVVGAFIVEFSGMIIVFMTCFGNRREHKKSGGAQSQKKRFGIF